MFFMLRILLHIIFILPVNNFILKNTSEGVTRDIKQDDNLVIIQDVQNTSPVIPTLIAGRLIRHNINNKDTPNLSTFDNTLPDEVLIKRHIHEKDAPLSIFKSTKSGIATPTLELKQKWPVVELLPKSDEFKEISQYLDEIEKKPFPFFHDLENESKIIELPPKIVNNYNLYEQNNQSVEKSVGLRSLLGHVKDIKPGGDNCICETIPRTVHKCPTTKACTRTTMSLSLMTVYMPYDIYNIPKLFPTIYPTAIPATATTSIPNFISPSATFGPPIGFPVGFPVGPPMGVPVGYPVGIPANFPMNFPGSILAACPSGIHHSYYKMNAYKKNPQNKKPSTAKLREELYYDDAVSIEENSYIYKDDYTNSIEKKRKHDKKYKGDIIIDISYDENDSELKSSCNPVENCNPPIFESSENFVKGFCNNLKTSYGETIIKDWYYSSAYSMKSRIVFVLITLVSFSL